MTENPLDPIHIFATPDSMDALMDYCERFNGTERVVAMTCAAMAWNLAHKYVEEAMKGESK